MLGRLIKYEWKRVSKVESLLLIVIFAFTLMGAVLLQTPLYTAVFDPKSNAPEALSTFSVFTLMMSFFMYVLMLFGASIGSMIFLGIQFYKSMYSDEGYLTHTLPVSSHQKLFSKAFVGTLWTIIMSVSIAVSVFILVSATIYSFTSADPAGYFSRNNFIRDFAEFRDDLFDVIREYRNTEQAGVFIHALFSGILAFFGMPFARICTLYGALTIGQLAAKHRALLGIGTYFLIEFVQNILTSMVKGIGSVMVITSNTDAEAWVNTQLFFSTDMKVIITILVGVGLYFLSHYIIEEKLNLN